jgi:hypothetical protein
MKATAASLSVVLLASSAQAQSAKEKYELSAQCAKQAADIFRNEWDRPRGFAANYENHYSLRFSKCFYIEITNAQEGSFRSMRLLHQNREMGGYDKWADTVVYCEMQGNRCASEEEWRKLIKPYMED